MQENEGNLEVAADLQEQLDKLEERALELDRLRSASISSVRSVATPGVAPVKSLVSGTNLQCSSNVVEIARVFRVFSRFVISPFTDYEYS